uniref:Uncharacterized protein n=1 Tax=Leersia perrieri TaxID=77586 RepID=A0A0D9XHD4_9ORYZ
MSCDRRSSQIQMYSPSMQLQMETELAPMRSDCSPELSGLSAGPTRRANPSPPQAYSSFLPAVPDPICCWMRVAPALAKQTHCAAQSSPTTSRSPDWKERRKWRGED